MSKKPDKTLQRAAKLVENALELDSNNRNEEAYVTYLESISFITSSLLDNSVGSIRAAKSGDVLSKEHVRKLVAVARQCLDRIETLTEEIKDDDPVAKNVQKNDNKDDLAVRKLASDKPLSLTNSIPGPFVDIQVKSPTRKYSSILEAIDWISPEEEVAEITLEKEISPLEKAKRENDFLITTYRARSSKAKTVGGRANLQLELQRRITENLQMARQKQEAFMLQLKEQKQRQLEKAMQAIRLSGNRSSKKLLSLVKETLEYEQTETFFAQLRKKLDKYPENTKLVSVAVKKTLQDQNHPLSLEVRFCTCLICDKIQSLEERGVLLEHNNNVGIDSMVNKPISRRLFKESVVIDKIEKHEDYDETEELEMDEPRYDDFVATYRRNADEVKMALKESNEKMATLKKEVKKQKSVIRKNSLKSSKVKTLVEQEETTEESLETCGFDVGVLKRQFESIVDGIQESFDMVVEMFVLAYGKAFESDEAREICYLELEQYFYPFLWPSLMHLCRIVNGSEEKKVEEAMNRLSHCTLFDLGYDSLPSTYSCLESVSLLKQMLDVVIPTNKLELLVKVAKVICNERLEAEKSISEDGSSSKSISADDLLPLLSYTCILTRTPQLISECYLLEALIDQKNLMGEGGYCLTSLLTSLHYIQTVEKPTTNMTVIRLESTV